VAGVGLRLLTGCDCGFEFRRRHGYLFLVSIVLYQLEVANTDRSLVQSSSTECGVSVCGRGTSQGKLRPTGAVQCEEEEKNNNNNKNKNNMKQYKGMQS
jgi:hypothetical protein